MTELVNEAMTLMWPLADAKRIAVAVDVPEVSVEADPERLFQVFANLMGNAIKFTPPEGTIASAAG